MVSQLISFVHLKSLNNICLLLPAADIEWFLAQNGVITDSELEENPRSEGAGEKSSVRKVIGGSRLRGYDSDDDNDYQRGSDSD